MENFNWKTYLTHSGLVAGLIILLFAFGYVSVKIFGNDNPVEKAAEHAIDEAIEIELKLPQDSVNVDLNAKKGQADNS